MWSVGMFTNVLLTVMFLSVVTSQLKPCIFHQGKYLCRCSENEEYADCSGRNLDYIPTLSNTTVRLNISRNSFTHLSHIILNNITNRNLTLLDVSFNNISNITGLAVFRCLEYLFLSNNPLSYQELEKLLRDVATTLLRLSLNNLIIAKFDDSLMNALKAPNLTYLELKFNHFKNISLINFFNQFKNIRTLDLSYNYIESARFSFSRSLLNLSLSYNDLTHFPKFCNESNNALFPNLEYLYLDRNCISTLEMVSINCLGRLKLLNISQTRINTLHTNTFSNLSSLRHVALNHIASFITIEPYAFQSKTLKFINLRDNDLRFKTRHINITTVFAGCPGLSGLDISGNQLGILKNSDWISMLQVIRNLEYLDISFVQLLYLPKAISETLPNLAQLHAHHNLFEYIPANYFDSLPNLKVLILSDNRIENITKHDIPINITHLNLARNSFACGCHLRWFLYFIKHNSKIMADYPEHYECSSSRQLLATLNIDIRSCLLGHQTSTIIQATCWAVMFLILLSSVVYRYRWRIRYLVYVLNYHKRNLRNCINGDHLYDVFVSCSEEDFDFVYISIVRKLEDDEGLRVYISERDAIAGQLKITSCLQNMDRSRFVVLCLSNSYSRDHWCEFEAYMALQKSIYEDKNSLLVVVLDDLSYMHVNKEFVRLLNENDYLIWDGEESTQELFWRKLRRRLTRT